MYQQNQDLRVRALELAQQAECMPPFDQPSSAEKTTSRASHYFDFLAGLQTPGMRASAFAAYWRSFMAFARKEQGPISISEEARKEIFGGEDAPEAVAFEIHVPKGERYLIRLDGSTEGFPLGTVVKRHLTNSMSAYHASLPEGEPVSESPFAEIDRRHRREAQLGLRNSAVMESHERIDRDRSKRGGFGTE